MSSVLTLALTWLDYLIFGATLATSTLIGIYFGCFGNKQSTIKDYLLGGKRMRILPIAVSVAVSHFSGATLVAGPAEVYRYGGAIWWLILSFIIMGFLGIYIYLPVFFRLQLTSIYEYLEQRFDKRTRILGFSFYILGEVLAFPVLVYTPALVFATASGFSVPLTGFILCVICVIYTTLGGLKSVVWSDLLQFMIIMTSIITVYIMGLNSAGGFLQVWKTALSGERLDLFNFDVDLTARDSFWGYLLGGPTSATSTIIVHQTGVQKFLALPKYSDCVLSMIYLVISLCMVYSFCILIGLVCYARYKDCDPLSADIIKKHDQLVPFFVTDLAGLVPGVSGLLIAGVCSASLSSMSSDLNALAAVVYKEFLSLVFNRQPSEKSSSTGLKLATFGIGLLCACLVFAVDKLGDIFITRVIIEALTKGPLLGLFTLGFVFPQANGIGAFYGTILSVIFQLCLIVPSTLYQLKGLIKPPTKPLSIAGCVILNQTSNWIKDSFNVTNKLTSRENSWMPNSMFRITFQFYPFFGFILTLFLGILISYFTKGPSVIDESLLSSVKLSFWSKKSNRDNSVSYSGVTQALDANTDMN